MFLSEQILNQLNVNVDRVVVCFVSFFQDIRKWNIYLYGCISWQLITHEGVIFR